MIFKEVFPSEIGSIIINFAVGIVLVVLLENFENFAAIIIMVPQFLSVRGNVSGSYATRVARDLMIGTFNRKNNIQNILATLALTILVSFMISGISLGLVTLLKINYTMDISDFFIFPLLVLMITAAMSIPGSTLLSKLLFKKGLNPNNIIPPLWSSVDDFLIGMNIYLILLLLGVP